MISPEVATLLLAFLRIATFVSLLPPFAGRGLPKTVKVGLALALALGMTTGHSLNAAVADESRDLVAHRSDRGDYRLGD